MQYTMYIEYMLVITTVYTIGCSVHTLYNSTVCTLCITALQCVSHQLSVINMHNQLSIEQNSAYLSKHIHLHDKEKY